MQKRKTLKCLTSLKEPNLSTLWINSARRSGELSTFFYAKKVEQKSLKFKFDNAVDVFLYFSNSIKSFSLKEAVLYKFTNFNNSDSLFIFFPFYI